MGDRSSVVITGASAGVGRATAVAFAERGWNVGLIARGKERLEAAAREVEAAGGQALVLPADVADADAVEAAAAEAEAAFGPPDVWVNNAMATVFGPLAVVGAGEYRRVTEVTYLGQVHGAMAALKRMRPRGRGTIVLVGSALAYRGIPLQAAYCGAKFALRGFADSLRSELLHEGSGVRVTMVQLPAVNTPQFEWARSYLPRRPQPVPPIFEPEPVAEAIVRAANEAPRELWVGRSAVQVILGNQAAPELLDQMMARSAVEGQQTAEAAQDRPDNLFAPVPGDFGARGRFGRRASRHVVEVSSTTVRGLIAAGALGAGLLAFALGRASAPARWLPGRR